MKMKKWMILALVALLTVSCLAGCGNKLQSVQYATNGAKGDYYCEEVAMDIADSAPAALRSSKSAAGSTASALPTNRKWIITMSVNAETDDLDAALEAIAAQITASNGYIEGQNVNNGSNSYRRYRSASMTVRIPAENVDAFVQEVSGLTNVTSSSRNVQDITLSYTDTEGRVNALKTEEARLLELMEKASNMSDLLEIEERLTEVRYQLESYSSTLRLYDNQVDYATVSLYVSEVEKYTPVEEPTFFQRISEGLSESIVDLGKALTNLAAWIIVNLPFLVCWALAIWGCFAFVKRRIRKHQAKKAAKKQAESKESAE